MPIFVLEARDDLPRGDDPWEPWYDKNRCLVVRAKDEARARQMADECAGDENRGEFLDRKIANTEHPWLDEKYSKCFSPDQEGDEEIFCVDCMEA